MSKYNRTYHLPWSPGSTNNDRISDNVETLLGTEIVITQSEESNIKRSKTQTGKKMSIESSIKKSISLKGIKSWNKGKKLSDIDKLNKSIAAKKLEKLECPYCGKLSDPGNSKKWHFDRCKNKTNTDL